MVSPDYFDVLRIPLAAGRNFTQSEARARAPVAIVSEATAHKLWPNESPLGQQIRLEVNRQKPAFTNAQVVGVARDVVNGYASETVDAACIYFPVAAGEPALNSLMVRVHGEFQGGRIVL